MKIIDVSVPLSKDLPTWPGVWQYELEWVSRNNLVNGEKAVGSSFRMCTHHGTHMDAPFHFDPQGITIDQIDPSLLVGPCKVYEYQGTDHIGRDDLEKMGVTKGQRVLIKTANSRIVRSKTFHEDYIALKADAMEYLLEMGVKLLGFDYFSIGPYGVANDEVHYLFLHAGGVIIETIDLTAVTPGEYQIMALPIKMAGLDGAPARVLLAEKDGDEN
jgi:arylformamidase